LPHRIETPAIEDFSINLEDRNREWGEKNFSFKEIVFFEADIVNKNSHDLPGSILLSIRNET